eukprot:SAG31_NODE_2345_length_5903_cov_1.552895_8_plen_317_part_00
MGAATTDHMDSPNAGTVPTGSLMMVRADTTDCVLTISSKIIACHVNSAGGDTTARMILRGSSDYNGRGKCFKACLEVSTQLYDQWTEDTEFAGKILPSSHNCNENFVTTDTTTSCRQRCTEDLYCKGYVQKETGCFFLNGNQNRCHPSASADCETEQNCFYWRMTGFDITGPKGPPTQTNVPPETTCYEARCARGSCNSNQQQCVAETAQRLVRCIEFCTLGICIFVQRFADVVNQVKCCANTDIGPSGPNAGGYPWRHNSSNPDVCRGVYGSGCLSVGGNNRATCAHVLVLTHSCYIMRGSPTAKAAHIWTECRC